MLYSEHVGGRVEQPSPTSMAITDLKIVIGGRSTASLFHVALKFGVPNAHSNIHIFYLFEN